MSAANRPDTPRDDSPLVPVSIARAIDARCGRLLDSGMTMCGEGEQNPPAENTIRWQSRPIADDFPVSLLLVAACVGACAGAAVAFGGLLYAGLAAVVLGVSLARYFLATDYEMDEQGVTVRYFGQSRTVPWSKVRRVTVGPKGVYLSPFEKASRLDSFRGTLLRFAGNAEKVVEFVDGQVASTSQVC